MYSRLFITMKADTAGYGLGGRSPSGRCILEKRGNICKAALTVQDIKPNVNYKAYIVEKQQEHGKAPRGVSIGNVVVDAQGRGELKKEFEGSFAGKLFFEDIGVVALVAGKASGSDTPLVGFENDSGTKSYMWKNFVDTEKEQVQEQKVRTSQVAEPEVFEPESQQQLSDVHDAESSRVELEPETEQLLEIENPQDDYTADELGQTEAESEVEQIPESDPAPTIEQDKQEWIAEPSGPMLTNVYKQNNPAALKERDEIELIFANNAELRPFSNRNKNYKWVRASLKEFAVLPIEFWRVMNNPLVVLYYEKYGHLILGRNKRSPSKLLIGVPAAYDSRHLPEARRIGFTKFECCEDKNPSEGDHGYWMLESRIS